MMTNTRTIREVSGKLGTLANLLSIRTLIGCVAIFMGTLGLQAGLLPIYGGFGYGLAKYTGDEIQDPLLLDGQQAEDEQSFYEAYVGVDLGDYWALEVNYAVFGTFQDRYLRDPDVVSFVSPNDEVEIDGNRATLMAKLEYPLAMGWSVFATGGYAYYDIDRILSGGFSPEQGSLRKTIGSSDHGFEYGFGAKWKILPHFSLRGQWAKSLIGDRDIQTNRISLEFHF